MIGPARMTFAWLAQPKIDSFELHDELRDCLLLGFRGADFGGIQVASDAYEMLPAPVDQVNRWMLKT